LIDEASQDRGGGRMGRKDDSTKDFKKAVKAVAKPQKRRRRK
jgi:hypothetical protein